MYEQEPPPTWVDFVLPQQKRMEKKLFPTWNKFVLSLSSILMRFRAMFEIYFTLDEQKNVFQRNIKDKIESRRIIGFVTINLCNIGEI